MKMKFLAALAVSSMFALTACSDESSSESLADKCGSLNEDCLIGTWSLQSINGPDGVARVTFGATTGELIFNSDGSFSYKSAPNSECDDGFANTGTWEITENDELHLNRRKGLCILESATFKPEIIVAETGDKATMNLKMMYFQQAEDSSPNHDGVEVFSRTE